MLLTRLPVSLLVPEMTRTTRSYKALDSLGLAGSAPESTAVGEEASLPSTEFVGAQGRSSGIDALPGILSRFSLKNEVRHPNSSLAYMY